MTFTDLVEEKITSVNVGKGGVNVNAGKPKPGGTSVNVGKGGVNVNAGKGKPGGTSVNVGKGGVNVNTGKGKPRGTSVNVGKGGANVNNGEGKPGGGGTRVNVGSKGGVSVSSGGKGKPVHVTVGKSPFIYKYAATETQVHDNPNVALFFLEKDMHPGRVMNLHFPENTETATFLPRQVAKQIPFSSEEYKEVLKQFSVKPRSVEAEIMKNTIEECEQPGIQGEERHCATSLESMIDFSISKLGKNVNAISTEVENQTQQEYTIEAGAKKMAGEKSVVCHKQNYAYAIFYCHETITTRAYLVPLEGADGTKAKAVAVCHTDTSAWNAKHLAFQVLKVKPGTFPICHFLPQDHIVWAPK
ncbi:hypothetical protein SLEP1_g1581 [Rubroshorea leprosula]|uniref:BURP domain-containing protein n=1 Tax=Rubroshorea leprosula TaxID=152421 RepID=A0AAV5HKY2_9ROSI|nr:hypothetical protein SLEP1_g1581 [Rubroshorea leprosula]